MDANLISFLVKTPLHHQVDSFNCCGFSSACITGKLRCEFLL